MTMVYVTFIIRPAGLLKFFYPTRHYAIKCKDMEQAEDAASDIYSFNGVSHIYFNKSGRLRHKDTKIIEYGTNYGKQL